MVDFRLIENQIWVEFEADDDGKFEPEYNGARASIDEWISHAKVRGESENSDPLTIKLLVELYKKVDELSNLIKNQTEPRLALKNKELTQTIGFEGFGFEKNCLEPGRLYFARVALPLFIKKEILLYFRAANENIAVIEKIASSDEKEWSLYIAESDRLAIRKKNAK